MIAGTNICGLMGVAISCYSRVLLRLVIIEGANAASWVMRFTQALRRSEVRILAFDIVAPLAVHVPDTVLRVHLANVVPTNDDNVADHAFGVPMEVDTAETVSGVPNIDTRVILLLLLQLLMHLATMS